MATPRLAAAIRQVSTRSEVVQAVLVSIIVDRRSPTAESMIHMHFRAHQQYNTLYVRYLTVKIMHPDYDPVDSSSEGARNLQDDVRFPSSIYRIAYYGNHLVFDSIRSDSIRSDSIQSNPQQQQQQHRALAIAFVRTAVWTSVVKRKQSAPKRQRDRNEYPPTIHRSEAKPSFCSRSEITRHSPQCGTYPCLKRKW